MESGPDSLKDIERRLDSRWLWFCLLMVALTLSRINTNVKDIATIAVAAFQQATETANDLDSPGAVETNNDPKST